MRFLLTLVLFIIVSACGAENLLPGSRVDLVPATATCPPNTSTYELRFQLVANTDCACNCGTDCSIAAPTARPSIGYSAAARACGPTPAGKCALISGAAPCPAGTLASTWQMNYKDTRICYCECDPMKACQPYHIDAGALDVGALVTVCCSP